MKRREYRRRRRRKKASLDASRELGEISNRKDGWMKKASLLP